MGIHIDRVVQLPASVLMDAAVRETITRLCFGQSAPRGDVCAPYIVVFTAPDAGLQPLTIRQTFWTVKAANTLQRLPPPQVIISGQFLSASGFLLNLRKTDYCTWLTEELTRQHYGLGQVLNRPIPRECITAESASPNTLQEARFARDIVGKGVLDRPLVVPPSYQFLAVLVSQWHHAGRVAATVRQQWRATNDVLCPSVYPRCIDGVPIRPDDWYQYATSVSGHVGGELVRRYAYAEKGDIDGSDLPTITQGFAGFHWREYAHEFAGAGNNFGSE